MSLIKRWATATLSLVILQALAVGASELIVYAAKEQTLFFCLITAGLGLLVAREDIDEHRP